ncbi:hypothetical protein HYX18_03490 [Candidatus Woesearchaeota archaeon]|nr:hypothetical protein [Candidatus Woesearchaeota archaeon]
MNKLFIAIIASVLIIIENVIAQTKQIYEAPNRLSITTFLALLVLVIILIILLYLSLKIKKNDNKPRSP